jgi:GNAT superfamily N-acetyltransferase
VTAAPIRRAASSEWRELGDLVGRAFAGDPLSLWTFGDTALVRAAFRALARAVYLPRGSGWFAGDLGGAMWLDPGARGGLPPMPTLGLALRLVAGRQPAAIGRALRVDAAFRTRRPSVPHAYLFAVGLLPQARGRGLGRALLAPRLERLDADGVPCWLENTNPANHAFYRALGFVARETFHPAPGAPPVTTMLRAPRRPPADHSHSIVAGGLPEMS